MFSHGPPWSFLFVCLFGFFLKAPNYPDVRIQLSINTFELNKLKIMVGMEIDIAVIASGDDQVKSL